MDQKRENIEAHAKAADELKYIIREIEVLKNLEHPAIMKLLEYYLSAHSGHARTRAPSVRGCMAWLGLTSRFLRQARILCAYTSSWSCYLGESCSRRCRKGNRALPRSNFLFPLTLDGSPTTSA